MAKALFHKAQRVYVKPVGTWSMVERVIPHWVKDVEQPLRVTYDVGLGREFGANELLSEDVMNGRERTPGNDDVSLERWRIYRARNRWQEQGDCGSHPYPGTFPIVLTDENDWGGWRVPGSEYDRDPRRIEHQARMIVNSPDMLRICKKLAEFAAQKADRVPEELKPALRRAAHILRHVYEVTETPRQAAE